MNILAYYPANHSPAKFHVSILNLFSDTENWLTDIGKSELIPDVGKSFMIHWSDIGDFICG